MCIVYYIWTFSASVADPTTVSHSLNHQIAQPQPLIPVPDSTHTIFKQIDNQIVFMCARSVTVQTMRILSIKASPVHISFSYFSHRVVYAPFKAINVIQFYICLYLTTPFYLIWFGWENQVLKWNNPFGTCECHRFFFIFFVCIWWCSWMRILTATWSYSMPNSKLKTYKQTILHIVWNEVVSQSAV